MHTMFPGPWSISRDPGGGYRYYQGKQRGALIRNPGPCRCHGHHNEPLQEVHKLRARGIGGKHQGCDKREHHDYRLDHSSGVPRLLVTS